MRFFPHSTLSPACHLADTLEPLGFRQGVASGRRVAGQPLAVVRRPTNSIVCVPTWVQPLLFPLTMFRRVRFQCGVCAAGFVDWHDEEWERTPVFCVNCGEAIVTAGIPVDSEAGMLLPPRREEAIALGVVKSSGGGFPDTLRGLRAARPVSSPDVATAQADTDSQTPLATDRPFTCANSEAPRARVGDSERPAAFPCNAQRRRKLAPLGALLFGFAVGVPITMLAEGFIARWAHPAAREAALLTEQLRSVSSALDDGNLERARTLLEQNARRLPASDRRVATLRARLTLSLILASRPDDARRELLAIQDVPGTYPPPLDIRRTFEAAFETKPSAATAVSVAQPSAPPHAPPKSAVASALPSRLTLLTAARDRQRRSLLDEAQRFYEQVLVNSAQDSEARCGLAEVQLLRGSVADARELFQRALRSNENYVPAWVGLADIDWLQGRAERAVSGYQLVVDRFPEGSYPPYITQRIARVMGSSDSPAPGRADRE